MNDLFFPRFEQLIAAHTGLHLRPRERDTLRDTLAARMAALRMQQPEAYQALLESDTRESAAEWEHLTALLTNNESYFFRDSGQMALLREHLLPEIIARNQARRTLRLWSAGCSTGEEAYSLAMLVEELLPGHGAASGDPWQIVILGTDIDEPALKQARKGFYSDWSFRNVDSSLQQRYFQRQGTGWQLRESSRTLVTFTRCNLFTDLFPRTAMGLYEMDLILCRNVFIYFAQTAISVVLSKFAQTLAESGYLMTGHTETQGQSIAGLQTRAFPASVIYQRVSAAAAVRTPIRSPIDTPPARQKAPGVAPAGAPLGAPKETPAAHALSVQRNAPVRENPPDKRVEAAVTKTGAVEAEALYAAGDYEGAIRVLRDLPLDARALLITAHAYANLGRYEEAAVCCGQYLQEWPFAAEPYELLAFLAEEQGEAEEAKELLKKALYLDPASTTAYVELAALYAREGDVARARKMRGTALELLQQLPPETPVGTLGGPPASEWIAALKRLLAEGA